MLKQTKKMVEKLVTEDIICNKCGKSLYNGYDYLGLVESKIDCSYYSKLGDGEKVKFSLCEDCLLDLFKDFAFSPLENKKSDYVDDVND
jgi:hypothetical protein